MNSKKFIVGLIATGLLVGCGTKIEQVTVQGTTGANGTNGQDGYSVVAKTVSNPSICGRAGGTTVYLALDKNRNLSFDDSDEVQTQFITCNGKNGTNGTNGTNGRDGLNGTSCTVNKVGSVSTITCGSSVATVLDGAKGDTGATGATGATGPAGTNASGIYITEILNPCGVEFSNEEVLLKLSNGRILALYDGGPNEDRLALIVPGNYITTDRNSGHSCAFTITNDYKLSNEHKY